MIWLPAVGEQGRQYPYKCPFVVMRIDPTVLLIFLKIADQWG
jgi:hypothetical protein